MSNLEMPNCIWLFNPRAHRELRSCVLGLDGLVYPGLTKQRARRVEERRAFLNFADFIGFSDGREHCHYRRGSLHHRYCAGRFRHR